MDRPIYSLHLFAGGGGGLLADVLGGVAPVCAVEIEDFPRRVLQKRFPGIGIWDDVRTFRADNPECSDAFGWFRENSDLLVVAGGFPCQDISAAGKGVGIDGQRSGLWAEFARVLREIRPRFAFVENSPLLVGRGLGRVLGDLAALGYDARWNVLGASGVGALHRRERIWITAHLLAANVQLREEEREVSARDADSGGAGGALAHPNGQRERQFQGEQQKGG